METFSALLALCAGNSPVTGEFPPQRPVTWSLDFSLIWAWTNDWVNNRDAGDLRRHRAHYDVIVMRVDLVAYIISFLSVVITVSVYGQTQSSGARPSAGTLMAGRVCVDRHFMMTSWRHDIEMLFALLTLLWGESAGHRRIAIKKGNQQTVKLSVIWYAVMIMWHHKNTMG